MFISHLNMQDTPRISIINEKKETFCGNFFSNRGATPGRKLEVGFIRSSMVLFRTCTDSARHMQTIGVHYICFTLRVILLQPKILHWPISSDRAFRRELRAKLLFLVLRPCSKLKNGTCCLFNQKFYSQY